MLPRVSRTFHGRDVFATAAAHLAAGRPPYEFGSEIHDYAVPEFTKPRVRKGELLGEVLHIDDFGNIVSNISAEDLEKMGVREGCPLHVKFKGKTLALKLCSAYGEVPTKKPLGIIGSSDFLEISVNQGNASKVFKAEIGDSVRVLFLSSSY
jgi:hypothetical protein